MATVRRKKAVLTLLSSKRVANIFDPHLITTKSVIMAKPTKKEYELTATVLQQQAQINDLMNKLSLLEQQRDYYQRMFEQERLGREQLFELWDYRQKK